MPKSLKYAYKNKEKCRKIAIFASKFRIVYEVVMIQQVEIFEMSRQTGLRRKPSGFKIYAPLAYAASPINGDAQICKHTSCGLSINENADPDVRVDMETIFNRLVPENRPEYEHTLEGAGKAARI